MQKRLAFDRDQATDIRWSMSIIFCLLLHRFNAASNIFIRRFSAVFFAVFYTAFSYSALCTFFLLLFYLSSPFIFTVSIVTFPMVTSSIVSARGFSLIEVMVALLVLAIGVLGLLMLQLASLRTTRDTLLHSSALQLATDIAGQIKGSTRSPEMLQLFSQVDYVATATVTQGGDDCYGIDSDCTPTQIAASAMREWQQRLRETVPGGRLRICRDASPWQTSSQSMRWECDAGTYSTGITDASSALLPIWVKVGWPSLTISRASSASTGSSSSAAVRTSTAGPQLALPVAAFLP